MRSSKSRSRNKSNRQRSIGNIINRVFDSSGPEGKVRGTPQQIIDKYLALARDAQLGNDRVAEQNFLQHAEHYTRMLGEAQREVAREQEDRQRGFQQNGQQNGGQNSGNGAGASNGGPANAAPANGGRERPERFDRFEREAEPRFDDVIEAIPEPMSIEDDGPGLVETPEMHVGGRRGSKPEEPAQAEFTPAPSDFSDAPLPEDAPAPPVGAPEAAYVAEPAATQDPASGEAAPEGAAEAVEETAPRNTRTRARRGPRRPKAEAAAEAAEGAAAGSEPAAQGAEQGADVLPAGQPAGFAGEDQGE